MKKLSALNPKDIGAKEKIKEAEKLVQVISAQLGDATNQHNMVDQEKGVVLAKAQQSSINSAHAKASAEHAFRRMVIQNNKVCNLCEQGKEKIRKRRAEIAGAIKEEMRRKAERAASRRRESLAKTEGKKEVLDARYKQQKMSLVEVSKGNNVTNNGTNPAALMQVSAPKPTPAAAPKIQTPALLAQAEKKPSASKSEKKSHKSGNKKVKKTHQMMDEMDSMSDE